MSEAPLAVKRSILVNAINWFGPQFGQALVSPLQSNFPIWALPAEIEVVVHRTSAILNTIQDWQDDPIRVQALLEKLGNDDANHLRLFRRSILLYRRHRAAETERLTEKAISPALINTLEADVKALDAMTSLESFLAVEDVRVPRLNDYLPVQFIESATGQVPLQKRQHDEKFHILQAPSLFFPDMAYFRAKCEDRETPLAIAFLDIDDFKAINSRNTESKVDRNLLPRFMQTIEAHMYHHGFAYRQGGDEYLILIPSLSRPLAIAFLDELRSKLAALPYPDIEEKTPVSIGLCIVETDCPLTDRELLDRANKAKEFAKKQGKNRIATYSGSRLIDQELRVVP